MTALPPLPRRVTLMVVGSLLATAAAAWLLTVHQATSMVGMATGLAHIGSRLPSSPAI